MKKLAIAAALATCAAAYAAPAYAADAPPAAATAQAYSTEATDIGTLLDNPVTKAVIDKHMPGFSSNPQIDMARSMTLKQIQQFAGDQVTDDVLAKIDTDLAKIPAAK